MTIWNFSIGQSNYFPLEKGTSFTYGYGTELYQGAFDGKRFKMDILSTTKTISGKEYLILQTSTGSDNNYSVVATSYVRIGKGGSLYTIEDLDEQEHVTIQGSPKKGDTWPSKNGKLTSVIKVVDVSGSIKTDGKTFTNCLVLEQTVEDGQKMQSYYKEGLGMVAITIFMQGSEKLFVYLIDE